MKIRWAAILGLMLAAASAPAQWGDAGPTLVFFDWGKSELSGDAKASLDKVAGHYRQAPRRMTVDGHSDRSGASASNLASSRRRAGIARDYLAGLGVPQSAMTLRSVLPKAGILFACIEIYTSTFRQKQSETWR